MSEAVVTQALRYYYEATPVVVRVKDFSQFLADVRVRSPSFYLNFDKAIAGVDFQKVKAAMEKLGRSSGRLETMPSPFFEAVAEVAGTVSVGQVATAAGAGILQGAEKIVGLASTSLMIYAGIAAFGIYILPKIMKGK